MFTNVPKGKVAVVSFLDNPSGTTYNALVTRSKDGITWHAPTQINTVTSNFNNDGFGHAVKNAMTLQRYLGIDYHSSMSSSA